MDITLIDETGKVSTEEIKEIENSLQLAVGLLEVAENTEISVISTDNVDIQMANRDYRGKDMPTDVISSALEDEGEDELPIIFDDEELAELPRNLGDLIISTERAAKQVIEYGRTSEREMGFLAVYGFLHSNRYDHIESGDEKEMFGLQKEILDACSLKR